jgi:hypothetical protein
VEFFANDIKPRTLRRQRRGRLLVDKTSRIGATRPYAGQIERAVGTHGQRVFRDGCFWVLRAENGEGLRQLELELVAA